MTEQAGCLFARGGRHLAAAKCRKPVTVAASCRSPERAVIIPSVSRFLLPVLFNVAVPGTGLVALGRPWVGSSLAGSFLLAAEVGILGLLVAPASVSRGVSVAALVAAGVVWLAGQGVLLARIRFVRSAHLPRELAILHRLAERAISRSDLGTAQAAIAVALSMDDTDVQSHLLRARVLTLAGRRSKARRAWLRVKRLDVNHRYAEEIEQNLEVSPRA